MCKAMEYKSIINDVLGPVTTGPSSSHTAAPARIGKAVSSLWGRDVLSATVTFDQQGSYPGTHVGQGSDMGFTGGLMGYLPDDPRLKDSQAIAVSQGRSIRFECANLGAHHPNEARLDVLDEHGNVTMSVLSFSTGGGSFLLVEMDGFPIRFDGQRPMLYCACHLSVRKEADRLLKAANAHFVIREPKPDSVTGHALESKKAVLYEIDALSTDAAGLGAQLLRTDGILFVRYAATGAPLPMRREKAPPFRNVAQALGYGRQRESNMANLAMEYELAVSLASEAEIRSALAHTLKAMRKSLVAPDVSKGESRGVMQPSARRMAQASDKIPTIDIGLLSICMPAAIAVVENSCAHNVIAAAPTAGASGVVPATVVALGDALSMDDEKIMEGLLAAGLVGSFIANSATFGAEEAGCQAEIGAAACMAAAGVVELMGGSVEHGFRASTIAMQSFLGLICDPVGGITEIPCITRNATASAVAVMAANMALCGFDPMIPLDETIETMLRVGRQLPEELRCTCKGGLCITPTGASLGEIIHAKNG
ncbi:MAG: hypothetical protein GXY67_04275 [Clostridiales bacterium]|nr:hypothetical protein [Clostridiales bacterium]